MNTNALLVVLVAAVTILAGSDTLKAEVLTGFEIEPDQVPPGENTLEIMNTGWVQANNAVVLISANDTIKGFTDLCVEGKVSRLDDSTLVAEFSRMSPYMPCGFGLDVREPVLVDIMISSDGRILPWIKNSPFNGIVIAIAGVFIFALIGNIVIYYIIMKDEFWISAWSRIDFQIHKGSFVGEEKKDAARTIDFVSNEYGSNIDDKDVRVLKLLHSGKTAKGQLKNHSGLTNWQINYRLEKLRRLELVLPDKMELSKAIQDHFEDDRPKT